MLRKAKIRRILIVEDDGIVALSMEQALREAGALEVQIVATTEDALAQLRAGKPDAVVLDVHLADRDDGWSIAELIDVIGPRPPRIVFSTGSPQDIPPEIARLGAVLEKPHTPDALISAICAPRSKRLFGRGTPAAD